MYLFHVEQQTMLKTRGWIRFDNLDTDPIPDPKNSKIRILRSSSDPIIFRKISYNKSLLDKSDKQKV